MSARHRRALAALGLLLLTFAVYAPSLGGEFIWGDDLYITTNSLMTAPDGLERIWASRDLPQYYPLTFTSFWIEWRLWGTNPAPYRAANIVLQGICAVLLWRLLRRLDVPGAWFAAAVFAVHPIQVDSVVWVSERVNVLSGALFLIAILAYLKYDEGRRNAWYVASLCAFTLALFSKTAVAVLPAVLIVLRWWKRRPWSVRDAARLIPFFVLSAIFAFITITYERTEAGAEGAPWEAGLGERLAVAGHIVWFYVGKLLIPVHLLWAYPRWTIDPQAVISYMPAAGVAVAAIVVALFARRIRSLAVALAWFLICLLPVLGFFDIYYFRYSYVADHFAYLAAIGVFALVVGGVAGVLSRRNAGRPRRIASVAIGLCVLSVLCVLNWRHQPAYRNNEALFRKTLEHDAGNCLAGVNLGVLLFHRGDIEGAIEQYRSTMEHNSTCDRAHNNLGDLLADQRRLDEAIAEFREAIRINPQSAEAYNNLGTVLQERGDRAGAIAQYRKALEVDPSFQKAHRNLAVALSDAGDPSKALPHYRRAVKVNPGSAAARFDLAGALSRANKLEDAAAEYREVLRIEPANVRALTRLAYVLIRQGQFEEAAGHCRAALAIQPNDAEAHTNLSVALTGQGKPQEAIGHAREAVRLDPGSVEAYNSLGIALTQSGELQAAVEALRQVVRLDPELADAHVNLSAALMRMGKMEEALPHLAESVRLRPDNADARIRLAVALDRAGREGDAIGQYREALRLRPDWATAAHALAHLLATADDPALRNGPEAVRLAEQACEATRYESAVTLDTLAAAYAEAGRFDEAVATARRAIELAAAGGQDDLRNKIEAHLRVYESRHALPGDAGGSR